MEIIPDYNGFEFRKNGYYEYTSFQQNKNIEVNYTVQIYHFLSKISRRLKKMIFFSNE